MKESTSKNTFFENDKNLLLRLKKYKDKEAFLAAYDTYAKEIYRFLYFKTSSEEEAQDLTSAVFVKAWQLVQSGKLKDEDNYKSLKAFLYRVARNEAIDYYRTKRTISFTDSAVDGETIDVEDFSQDLAENVALNSEIDELTRNLSRLKSEYRNILTLYYINELTVPEIAQALGKTKGAVRVTVFRALKALKQLMEE